MFILCLTNIHINVTIVHTALNLQSVLLSVCGCISRFMSPVFDGHSLSGGGLGLACMLREMQAWAGCSVPLTGQ